MLSRLLSYGIRILRQIQRKTSFLLVFRLINAIFAAEFIKRQKKMISKQELFKTVSPYVIAYLVLLMVVLGLLYSYPKPELHMMLNSHHTDIQDTFFKYYTLLAEWPLYILALLPLLWKKRNITIFYAICEAAGGVMVQILKHLFSSPRPVRVFENYPDMVLPLVDGVDMHHSNSFPSGHSSTFFIFATCCVIILAYHYISDNKPKTLRTKSVFNTSLLVLLAMAALGGYSRIYLSQHFLSDVCVGSIIGVTMPLLMFYLCGRKFLDIEHKTSNI